MAMEAEDLKEHEVVKKALGIVGKVLTVEEYARFLAAITPKIDKADIGVEGGGGMFIMIVNYRHILAGLCIALYNRKGNNVNWR